MTKEVTTACVPVVFSDGDKEIDLGDVYVHPSVGPKHLQTLIAKKIGLSPHQISLSTVSAADTGRKIPVSSILFDKSCYLLATLNRSPSPSPSRRSRRRSRNSPEKPAASPEKVLLRRDPSALPDLGRLSRPPPQLSALGLMDQDALVELRRFQMRYAAAAGPMPVPTPSIPPYEAGPRIAPYEAVPATGSHAVCEVCDGWKEEASPPFHLCVYDPVVPPFRTKAGPIQRPNRGRAG